MRAHTSNPMNLIRVMPAEGLGASPHGHDRPCLPSWRLTVTMTRSLLRPPSPVGRLSRPAQAEKPSSPSTPTKFRRRMRSGTAGQGRLREGMRLHARMGRRPGRRRAAQPAQARRLRDEGRRRARPRHQPRRGSQGARAVRTARPRSRRATAAGLEGRPFRALRLRYSPSSTTPRPQVAAGEPRRTGRSGGREKIIIEDPRTSTPGLGLLLWMQVSLRRQGRASLAEVGAEIVTVTPGWSEAYGLFTKGEAPMVLSYTTSPAYHMIARRPTLQGGGILRRALSADRGGRRDREPREAGTCQAIPRVHDRARNFRMLSLPRTGCGRPAKPSKPLPAEFDKLVKPRSAHVRPGEVAGNRKAWTEEWLNATSR